jgi:GrpB-like predicted nucleotidyltransferase (UPF0157 family)
VGAIFEGLRNVYLDALGELVVAVEHVGSTAVPGLLAKPIIDIDLVIQSRDDFPGVTSQLAALGYRHAGDLESRVEKPSRETGPRMFPEMGAADGGQRTTYTRVASGSTELRRHLAFRDWLRSNPEAAVEYGKLKERLAELYRHDCDALYR